MVIIVLVLREQRHSMEHWEGPGPDSLWVSASTQFVSCEASE